MPPLEAEAFLNSERLAADSHNASPSPSRQRRVSDTTWGGVRGGGNPNDDRSAIPPSLSLPHKGGGDDKDREVPLSQATGPIWHAGAFHPDTWAKADAASPLPDGPVLLPKMRWLAERDQLIGRIEPVGLIIAAGEHADDIAGDLGQFALVALEFPKFSDGRAFSTARLLREKHGYAGELRAIGNVLADQIPFMRRVGFDSFEVSNGSTRRALVEGRIAEVTLHYQPAATPEPPAGTRPWLRRSGA